MENKNQCKEPSKSLLICVSIIITLMSAIMTSLAYNKADISMVEQYRAVAETKIEGVKDNQKRVEEQLEKLNKKQDDIYNILISIKNKAQ
jgi:uncharacterized membrane protein (DUF106 family)